MSGPGPSLVLASGSPRRRELLDQLGLPVVTRPPDVDETPEPGEDPVGYVRRLARAKASAVPTPADAVVIAADTTVELDGRILGKPVDLEDARTMLRALSGRTHRVHTGVAVRRGDQAFDDVATTLVTFAPVTDAALDWYLRTGEPLDKAGAYAIQGAGGVFVERVQGSVSNVVGLPLTTLARLLARVGVELG
jgi:septum formation protein